MNTLTGYSLKDRTYFYFGNLKWVFLYIWKTSRTIFLAILTCKVLNSAIPAAIAWIGRCLINAIVDASKGEIKDFDIVMPWILMGLGIAVLSHTINVVTQFLDRRLVEEIRLSIDFKLLNHASELDISMFEDQEFQNIIERAKQNTSDHVIGFYNKLLGLVTGNMTIIGLVTVLFIIDPIIPFLTIPIVLPYMLFRWSQSKLRFEKEYNRATKRRWSSYFVSMVTDQRFLPEVKILKLAKYLIGKYKELADEFLKQDRAIYKREFTINFIFSVIFAISFYFLFGWLARRVIEGNLTIGDVAMFAGATRQLQNMLTSLAGQVSGVMEESLYIDNIIKFFNVRPNLGNVSGKKMPSCRGEIEIKDLFFSYPGTRKNVLDGISLYIKPGETIAIVGENGAGKTTLVKLISRLYDPDKGKILIDGTDIRDISPNDLRTQISFVFQTGNRYEASAADNIVYGDIRFLNNREHIKKIARISQVDKMIDSMPEKYDTILGRKFGEYDLSGGQWQKIVIARAIAREDSSILILDEPATNLDAHAKQELYAAFKKIIENRTTIIISHRLSTINLAKKIIVMKGGRIVESGSHEELITLDGYYSFLYNINQSQKSIRFVNS